MRTARIFALVLTLSLLTACQTTQGMNGAGLGGLLGATVGALTFKNKISGAAIGAGVGTLAGYMVGNEMDKADQAYVSNVLETAPSGRTVAWSNPDSQSYYQATPHPPRYDGGRVERDVTLETVMPDGRVQTVYARAYRQPDGSWQLVQ